MPTPRSTRPSSSQSPAGIRIQLIVHETRTVAYAHLADRWHPMQPAREIARISVPIGYPDLEHTVAHEAVAQLCVGLAAALRDGYTPVGLAEPPEPPEGATGAVVLPFPGAVALPGL